MGAAVAGQAAFGGYEVLWCPTGRSEATMRRAGQQGLKAVASVGELTARADIILSICPPANAEQVAAEVAACGFSGTYVDGNAVAPGTVERIGGLMRRSGAVVVDGAIVGSPPSTSKNTRLYLSGPQDALSVVAALFADSAVHPYPLAGGLGRASALKLAYSSYQKSSRVLAAVAYALAAEHGVEGELLDIAQQRTSSYLAETDYFPKVAARSWRWGPEMQEVAQAMREAGLPSELAEASATAMSRWTEFRDSPPSLSQAIASLHNESSES
nr:NAD(P)-dependent oxidoreductase [Streptomyces sp. SID5785]